MNSQRLSRREFCVHGARLGLGLGCAAALDTVWLRRLLGPTTAFAGTPLDELLASAPIARYWASVGAAGTTCFTCHAPGSVDPALDPGHPQNLVKCQLCAQECAIPDGQRGRCRTRINVGGELRSLVYGRPLSVHTDPIEKKPFFHFLPGSPAFSMSTSGCPLHCKFCQNWEISQARPEDYERRFVSPKEIVSATKSRKAPIIAFTYNEPTVFTEYLTDIAREARPSGIRSVMVSCGFMNSRPLAEMCDVLDGIKIDLKGFSPDFYRDVCSAELEPVLRSIQQVARSGRHLEIVNLVVPTLNDSDAMLRELVAWVAGEIGPDVPIHFTRFHPDYQLLNLPPTPIATLERARALALEAGLHYPYVGNVPGHPGNNTYCPSCGKAVILRQGFFILENHIEDGSCGFCKNPIAGVWS